MRFPRIALVVGMASAVLLWTGTAAWADREPVKIDNTKEFVPGPPPEAPPEDVLAPPEYIFLLPPPSGRTGLTPTTGPAVTPTTGPTATPVADPTTRPVTPKKRLRALQAVPSKATAVAWFTDMGRTRTLLADCALGKLGAEPGVQRFLGEIAERLESPDPGIPSYGYLVRAADLMRHLSNDAAIALVGRKGKLRVILVAAVREEKRSAVETAARDLSEALAGGKGAATAVRERLVAGARFREVLGEDVAVYHGFVENLLVLATDLEGAEAAARLASAGGAGSFEKGLARSECLKALDVSAEADLYLTANFDRDQMKRFLSFLAAVDPAGAERAKAFLGEGKGKIGSIHAALAVEDDRILERIVLGGGLSGMRPIGAGAFRRQKAAVLRYIPPDALYFEAGNLDLASLFALVEIPLPTDGGMRLLKGVLDGGREKLEPALGTRFASGIFVPMTGGLQSVFALELKDPKPVRVFLGSLHKGLGLTERTTFLGETLHCVREEQGGRAGRPSAGSPRAAQSLAGAAGRLRAYTITKANVLVLASSEAALRKTLRSAALAHRNVLALPHVKEATAKLPLEEASAFTYLDAERAVEFFYISLLPQMELQKAERLSETTLARLRVLFKRFPLLDELLPHLGGAACTWRRKGDALVVDVRSATGFLPSASLGVAAALPAFARASEISEAAHHERHLRIIWRGLQDYATNHGRFPRKLEYLYPDYVQFGRPGVELDQRQQKAILAQYAFAPSRRPNDCATAPLAYTAKPTGTGVGHVVLVMDGRMVPVTEPELERLLRGEISIEDILKRARMKRGG